jgi:hypothetical protein
MIKITHCWLLCKAASQLGEIACSARRLCTTIGACLDSQLTEVWRAEVQGGRMLRAGVIGAVIWQTTSARSLSANVPFCLAPPESPSTPLLSALRGAQRHVTAASAGKTVGTFIADAISSLPISTPLLRCVMLAGVCLRHT